MVEAADTGAANTGATNQEPWYQGADAETIGYLQNRGLDKLTPKEAAFATVKAHREASQFLGVPEARLIKLPADPNDEAGWNGVHRRLGAPENPDDYKTTVAGVKFADNTDLAPAYVDAIAGFARRAHLSVDNAKALASEVAKLIESDVAASAAEEKNLVETQINELKGEWGAGYETNKQIAVNAAKRLDLTNDELDALESTLGFRNLMTALVKIGTKTGEDTFLRTSLGGKAESLTKEMAAERIKDLKADKDWSKRYLEGGLTERKEFENLHKIALGAA